MTDQDKKLVLANYGIASLAVKIRVTANNERFKQS